jgi:hypothetical protein
MTVVFSTCWYPFKAKFNTQVYQTWIDHFISNVESFYLVIYTSQEGIPFLTNAQGNPRIRIVVKPLEEFRQYCHKDKWIENHAKNIWLNQKVGWEVSVLWAEKVHFVKETIQQGFFVEANPSWYGWCDIGYFRPQSGGCLTAPQIRAWPDPQKLAALDPSKIHYALVNPYIIDIVNCIKNTDPHTGLPQPPIPPNQVSIAGGFFLTTTENLEHWATRFDQRLAQYFQHGALVKDDQIIIIDCILSDPIRFQLHREETPGYDNWFMFQRLLM